LSLPSVGCFFYYAGFQYETILSVLTIISWVLFRKSLPMLRFPLVVSKFQVLALRSFDQFWIDFCMGSDLVFLTPLVKEAVIFSMYIFSAFVENQMAVSAWTYFWIFYLIGLCVCFWLVTNCVMAL
jgi:hypothetical protein